MFKDVRIRSFVTFITLLASFVLKSQINILPSDLPGLSLWYTGDSVDILPGNFIDKCYDLSSNNNQGIQPISANQPQSISSALNGHKSILLDGVDDRFDFTEISTIRTVLWIVKESSIISPSFRPLLGHSSFYNFHRGNGTVFWDNLNADPNVVNGITKLNHNIVNGTVTQLNPQYSMVSLVTAGNVRADNFSNDRITFGRVWGGELLELIIYDQALSPSDIIQLEAYLNNKYAPDVILPNDITVTNSLCDTIISPSGYYTNYNWSTGATTPTISVNQTGKYWVNATNVFGKISSDTILVSYPGNFLSQNATLCFGDSLIWNTNLPKSQYTFQWQNNSTDSTFTVTQGGPYYVKVTDGNGCSVTSNTITVTQDNFPTTASLGPDITMCSGNLITLTQGMSPSLTYTWSTGSNNDSLLITTTGLYSVIVTNTNNCVAKDTIVITIQGLAPTANFTTNIGCVNSTVAFTDLSVPPSGNSISNYAWSFGDTASPTNTSTASNPTHTYTNTGTYTVNLTVTTNSNCEQSIIKIINVYPVPTVTFAIGTSCQNDTTSFLNQSTGITGYSITSSYWNFGDSSPTYTSNVTSPKHVFTNVLTYSVTLMVTNSAGCASSIIKTITPKYEVKANFTNGPACANSATNFQSTSVIPPSGTSTYDWNFGIPNSNSNVQSPSKTYTNSGVYYVTLNVDGQNGCTSSITKMITVFLPPVADFSITSFCSKDTINIINTSTAQSGVLSSYDWKLNNVSFSAAQNPTLSLTTPTIYSVKLDVTNSFGCKDVKTYSLTIFPLPVVDFSTTPIAFYYINEPVSFTPSIVNAASYLWNMNGASTYSIQSPTETFNTEGPYNVSLNLRDQNGCKGSKTKNITISKRHLDLAILNVRTTKDNYGFMTVIADIANYGSVPINSFKMGYQISDGGNINETWNGTLNPTSFYVYTFNATSAITQNSSNYITCVEIDKVNTIIDDNTTNNSLCNSLYTDDIYVANPLPNPTNGDIVLPITLNRGFDYTIAIYNSVGQIQYEETTKKGIEGLNFVTLNTSSYARGAYIIKVMIDEKIFIKKFIKTSFE